MVVQVSQCGAGVICRAQKTGTVLLRRFRLTAFTSEVGESLRPIIARWKVDATYGVSWLYVIADVVFKACAQYKLAPGARMELVRTMVESAIFHSVATMLVPAVLVHSIVHLSQHALHAMGFRDENLVLVKWTPTGVGFACIPLIPKLFDGPLEWLLHMVFARCWPAKQ